MANVLKPERQEQVRALGRLGWSLRRIQGETGVHRDSVRRYLTEAGIQIRGERSRRLPAGAPKPASQVTADPGADSKPASQVFPDSGSAVEVLTSAAKSSCEPHRDFIATALDQGRNGKSIWQDLVDHHGFTNHYESVKRFIRQLRPSTLIAPADHDRAGRGRPGRLRHRPDGAPPADRQVSPDAVVRPDIGMQPEGDLVVVLGVELAAVVRVSRGSVPPARWRTANDGARQPA